MSRARRADFFKGVTIEDVNAVAPYPFDELEAELYFAPAVKAATRELNLALVGELNPASLVAIHMENLILEDEDEHVRMIQEAEAECWAEQTLREATSWMPVDWSTVDNDPIAPTLFMRSDGKNLLYPGRVHSINGESEAGKSFLTSLATVERVKAGETVLYVDFEADAKTLRSRLLQLGLTLAQIQNQVIYIRPVESMTEQTWEQVEGVFGKSVPIKRFRKEAMEAFNRALDRKPTFAVLDGLAEALVIDEKDENSNQDVTEYIQGLPRYLAHNCKMTVVIIDHLPKGSNDGPRGAGAKVASVDGVVFMLERKKVFAKGIAGRSVLSVKKDRHGGVREHAQGGKVIAVMNVSATGEFTVDPPETKDTVTTEEVQAITTPDRIKLAMADGKEWCIEQLVPVVDKSPSTVASAMKDLILRDPTVIQSRAYNPSTKDAALYRLRPTV